MKSQQPVLSVCLAVHNEAQTLAACLTAVADIADEIVIVDGASTDDTLVVAKKYKARIISTTNKANFHINKQMALDAALGIVVLQLDADEVVDDELHAFLRKLKQQMASLSATEVQEFQPKAWWLPRKNYFFGRFLTKGGQYPDPVIRLFIRGFAHLPQRDVHEQMVVDGEVQTASGHLLHFGNPSLSVYFRKSNTYTSFAAAQLFQLYPHFAFGRFLKEFLLRPPVIFCSLFFRHRGYVDGSSGFVFALLSSMHPATTALKWWELTFGETKNTSE